jgi:hypothetical protein
MDEQLRDDPTAILRVLLDDEAVAEDLRRRARLPERDIEPVFNRCFPVGYRKPRKIAHRRKNPKKEVHRAIQWKQHLVKVIQRHKQASIRFWNRRYREWLRQRREAIQPRKLQK